MEKTAYVALLRGINVGGKNKLAMRDLIAMFQELGCIDVRNYVQSGNIVFRATPKTCQSLPKLAAAEIASRFGLAVPVILRSAEQMAGAIAANPFRAAGVPEAEIFVMFLAGLPDASRVAALDPNRSPGDTFQVVGQEIYLRLTNGAARSKLTNAYFDSKLATVSTARNWRTVTKLLEMMTSA